MQQWFYLFLPLCSDGEILLGFGAVGEMRESLPWLWFLHCGICSSDLGNSIMSLSCCLVKMDFTACAGIRFFSPPHPLPRVIRTPDSMMGFLTCSETCVFSSFVCSNVSEEMNILLVALFPLPERDVLLCVNIGVLLFNSWENYVCILILQVWLSQICLLTVPETCAQNRLLKNSPGWLGRCRPEMAFLGSQRTSLACTRKRPSSTSLG